MAAKLHDDGHHACVMFADLVGEVHGEASQSNQYLVVDGGHGALVDPGGNMTYNALFMACAPHFPAQRVEAILATNADADAVASLGHWLLSAHCRVYVPALWAQSVPHLSGAGRAAGRIAAIPDPGAAIVLGDAVIHAVPAHFLHSAGNVHFYDPVARVLFSGDLASSAVPGDEAQVPVEGDLGAHVAAMAPFHRRAMAANKVLRLWTKMARQLDLEWIAPRRGRPLKGKRAIGQFFDWLETLACGTDLVDADTYRPPGG
ncbi:MAG: MBL fold metallo-hydrolase [Burkholderiales bacterium]|nr:MBL fold metallo-hydrolase [Burkholderiales bacterium]